MNSKYKLSRRNTSGYKGVSMHAFSGLWRAYITVEGTHKYLGYYPSAREAALAYDEEARSIGRTTNKDLGLL